MTEQYDDFQYFGNHTIISFGCTTFRSGALRIECCFEKTVLSVFLFKRHTSTFMKNNSSENTTQFSRKHFLQLFFTVLQTRHD